MRVIVIIITFFILTSCANKKQILYGIWEIGSLKSEKHNYEEELLGNNFYFLEEDELRVPRMLYQEEYKAIWDISTNKNQIDSLFVKSKNIFYEGDYRVDFLINNVNSRLFMRLKSNKLEIVLYIYFETKKERDRYIYEHNIMTTQVPDDYFPQLKISPDNRKTFEYPGSPKSSK